MEQHLTPIRFALAGIIALAVLLGASLMLPHERYYRFQAHDNGTTRKADWIYERLHFDQTPIDVALIGTSRTGGGLSSPLIEREYCKMTGRRIHVANLGLPQTGRNMHFILAREAALTKTPALTIIELNDVETRKPHPGFIFLADAKDILSAPIAINLNYFSDLARLPGRQASLFAETILERPAIRAAFSAEDYEGPYFDRTLVQIDINGSSLSRNVEHNRDEMNAMRGQRLRNVSPLWMTPKPLHDFEYRFSKYYLKKIETTVAAHDGEIIHAYLPAYGESAPTPVLLTALEVGAPNINLGGELALDPSLWLDATHLNAGGATLASVDFAHQLARIYPALGKKIPCE